MNDVESGDGKAGEKGYENVDRNGDARPRGPNDVHVAKVVG